MFDVVIGRNEKDREKLGTKGTILLGKHFVKMGRVTSLSNPVYMDMTRSHVVFICGKRGGGKCVKKGTLITLSDGSRIPVEDLEHSDKDVLALNDDLKIQKGIKSDFYKRTVSKLLKIKLRSGKEIELTPEHPLLTIDGWKPVTELMTGSRIATPRKMSFFGEELINEERIKLLAYLIAEGHIANKMILFSNMDSLLVDDFSEAVRLFDKNLVVSCSRKGTYRVARPKVQGEASPRNSLKAYLTNLGIYEKNSYDKFVPNCVFAATKSNISLFLNRLFSCDGTIYFDTNKNSWRVGYASSSKKLIFDVQSLLLKFSILSTIRSKLIRLNKKKFFSFELEIQSACIPDFLQEIGFFGKKVIRQRKALREVPLSRNPNIDTIPKEVWDSYTPKNWAEIGRKMGYAHPKALRESIRYAPSRQKLLQIAIHDNQEHLKLLAESDIYWDEIERIEKISGNFEVYDITVPEHHNFVANDIIVHNSYTMGVIAEGMADLPPEIKKNISIIMLDTMGIYWTMKYPNKKEKPLLNDWGLQSKGLDVKIYTPTGYYKAYKEKGIPTDAPFSVLPGELSASDWLMTFGVKEDDPVGVLIERVIHKLSEEHGTEFGIETIMNELMADEDAEKTVRLAARNRFLNVENWGLFDEKGTPLKELARGGQVTVLDVSCYATMPGSWNVKNLVIGLVAQKLFIQRMIARKDEEFSDVHDSVNPFADSASDKQDYPLVWLVIDEAHEFLPVEGKTLATDPLVTILREGRQPGISLILATQQPGKIHTDVMTQSDTVISHRITARLDTEALGMLMQSYMRKGLVEELDNLPRVKGAAIIFDDTNERMYPIRVRPRFTWHGGEAPNALKNTKDEIKF